jgi:hypothetical protein
VKPPEAALSAAVCHDLINPTTAVGISQHNYADTVKAFKKYRPQPFTKNSFALYLNDSYKYNIFGKFWDHRELEPKRYEETTTLIGGFHIYGYFL